MCFLGCHPTPDKSCSVPTTARRRGCAIYDVSGTNAPRQLALGGNSRYPLWSSDGAYIAFQHDRNGARSIFRQRVDGRAAAEPLTTAAPKTAHIPETWSPDGRHVLFNVITGEANELWVLDVVRANNQAALRESIGLSVCSDVLTGWQMVRIWQARGRERAYCCHGDLRRTVPSDRRDPSYRRQAFGRCGRATGKSCSSDGQGDRSSFPSRPRRR